MSKKYELTSYSIRLVKDKVCEYPHPAITCPDDGYDIFREYLDGVDREHFVVAFLNVKHRIIGINTVSIGSLRASVVQPREVFKAAVLANAGAIVLCHNHPSGDTAPSKEDISVTQRLVRAGKILDILVLDHLIIGEYGYTSMKKEGFV